MRNGKGGKVVNIVKEIKKNSEERLEAEKGKGEREK